MKKLLLIVVAVLFSTTTFAQMTVNDMMHKGIVSIGSTDGGKAIGGSCEQGILGFNNESFITAGGYLGYDDKHIKLMAQGNYYLPPLLIRRLDLYVGLRLGYATINKSIIYSAHAGGNYWLTPNIALTGEAGYGIATLSAGVALKF